MRKLIKITANNSNLLKICYDLGNICNYKCWYCFPGSNEGTIPFPDVDIVKENISSLINYYINNKIVSKVELNLLGGEPTLWKDLGTFVQYVKENTKNTKIQILTNGTKSTRWWKQYGKFFNDISISVHHEKANIDHIIRVSETLYDLGVVFNNTIVFDPMAWDKCISIYEKLMSTKKKWPIVVKPLHFSGSVDYTEEQKIFFKNQLKRYPAIFDLYKYLFVTRGKYYAHYDDGTVEKTKNSNYFALDNLNHFMGWECSLGKNWVFINRNGELSGTCGQKIYGLPFSYNINNPSFARTFKPRIVPIICRTSTCLCSGEAALPKRKIS